MTKTERFLYLFIAVVQIVCPLIFFTDLTRNPYYTQIVVLNASLLVGAGLVIINALRRGRWEIWRTPLDGALAVFLAAATFSWLLSWVQHPTLRASIWNEGLRVWLFLAVNCYLAYGLSVQMRDGVWRERYLSIILMVGGIAAGYGILQYFGIEMFWSKALNPYNGRPVSTFGNPNFLSSFLVILLPLLLADLLGGRTLRMKIGKFLLFALYLAAILCTLTRSSWVGAFVACAGFLWVVRRRVVERIASLRWFVLALLVAAALWPASPLSVQKTRPFDRIQEAYDAIKGGSVYAPWHQRLMIWSSSWDMVHERPLWGKGWGCFELFYPFYQGRYIYMDVLRVFRTHANNAHNLVLEFWSQMGTLGLGLFVWMCLLAWFIVKNRLKEQEESVQLRSWALLLGGLGMLVDNFFGNVSLFFAVPAFLFWWLLGLLMSMVGPEVPVSVELGTKARRVALLAVLVLLGSGVWRNVRYWLAEVHYFKGFKLSKKGDVKGAIPELERAMSYHRHEVNNAYELANAYARQARSASELGLSQESKIWTDKALEAYRVALESNAGYDEIYFNRATVMTQARRVPEAILNYRVSLLINPLSLEAYKALGNIYLMEPEHHGAAERLFEQALFFFPRDKDLWNNLGYIYTRLSKHDKALEAYSRAFELDVTFSVAWKNIGVSLQSLGRKDHPYLSVPSLWDQSVQLASQKRFEEARRFLEQLTAVIPANWQVWAQAGNVAYSRRAWVEAVRCYRKSLEIQPDWTVRLNLGKVYAVSGQTPAAVEHFKAMLSERPMDPEVTGLLSDLNRTSAP
ncbi:MAG TPA: O-antigen ligase family protein [Elusimicrobiota bacterium]|nr:O-antigen ligase family protein [Elusimicrobiota bacterium]